MVFDKKAKIYNTSIVTGIVCGFFFLSIFYYLPKHLAHVFEYASMQLPVITHWILSVDVVLWMALSAIFCIAVVVKDLWLSDKQQTILLVNWICSVITIVIAIIVMFFLLMPFANIRV